MNVYIYVLAQSWAVTSTYPQLWLLGLFAVFVAGNGGAIDRYLRYVNNILADTSILNPQVWQQSVWYEFGSNILTYLQGGDVGTWIYLLLLVAAVLLVAYVIVVAQGALIYAAGQKTARAKLPFADAFREGHRHVVSLFFLNLIVLLILTLSVYLLNTVAVNLGITTDWYEARMIGMLLSGIVLIPVVLVSSYTARFAANYIVLQDKHLGTAISLGAKMFFANWLVTLELSVIVFVLSLVLNLLLVVAVFLMMTPYAVPALLLDAGSAAATIYDASFVGGLTYIVGLLLLTGIFSTWQWGAWTKLFNRLLKEKNHTGKIIRLLQS